MAVTLIDHLKNVTNPLTAGVIQALLMRSEAMKLLPFANLDTLNIAVTRWNTLPTTAFRQINAAYAESAGTREQVQETVYPIGGYTDTDVMLSKDKQSLKNERADQLDMRVASMSYTFNDYFINGSQATDPDGFTGLKVRVASLPAAQSIVAATNGLDVKATTANQNTFMDLLDQLLYAIDNGFTGDDLNGKVVLFVNDSTFLGLASTLRRLGLFDTTRDQFGRTIPTYKGAPIYDIGVKSDQSTRIIPNTETTGSSNATTSIYAVKVGSDDGDPVTGGEHFHGIQEYPLDTIDHGRLQTKSVERTEIDWPVGLAHFNKRSIARLSGIIWS